MPMTGELARLDDELRRAYDGDCWHGPPLREILRGVTAATATAQQPQLVHSIWGLVNHLAAWVEVVTLRIVEWRPIETPEAGDFPPVADDRGPAWAARSTTSIAGIGELLRVVGGLEARGWTRPSRGRTIRSR